MTDNTLYSVNNNVQTTQKVTYSKKKSKEERPSITTNIIDTAKTVSPVIEVYSPKAAAIVRTTIKTKEHVNKPTINLTALSADSIAATVPFIYGYSKKAAISVLVGSKGLKASSEYQPADTINTILQAANVVIPVVSLLNPSVAVPMEVTINLAKLYHNSKMTSANKDLYSDLASAFVPVVKFVNKKSGIALEVLTTAAKTETGKQIIQFFQLKISTPTKQLNDDQLAEMHKIWNEALSNEKSEWTVQLSKQIDNPNSGHNKLIEEFLAREEVREKESAIQYFEKLWNEIELTQYLEKALTKAKVAESVEKALQRATTESPEEIWKAAEKQSIEDIWKAAEEQSIEDIWKAAEEQSIEDIWKAAEEQSPEEIWKEKVSLDFNEIWEEAAGEDPANTYHAQDFDGPPTIQLIGYNNLT